MARSLLCLFRKHTFYNCNLLHHKNNVKFSQSTDSVYEYTSKYNEEEQRKIFEFLNESSPESLLQLSMSEQRLKRIISRRLNKGKFNTFSDILDIDGLGVKVMERMCDSILNFDFLEHQNVKGDKKRNKIKGKVLEPSTPVQKLKSITTATAIHIHGERVAWAQIEKDTFRLINWSCYDLGTDDNKKLQLSEITEIIWNIIKLIPRSDFYIMEAPLSVLRSSGADAKNPKAVNVNLQKAQFTAVLNSALNIIGNIKWLETENIEFDHKVLYLRASLPSRLYRTLIGNEKVSAEDTVKDIITNSENTKLNHSKDFDMPSDIKNYFYNEHGVHKEILSQTLLLALAFFEVCVFENLKAIEKLTRDKS